MSTKSKTYTLTQRDYDILLSSVLHNPIALGVLQRIAGNTSDKLDDDKMEKLFGSNYHGITYFNFETNKLENTLALKRLLDEAYSYSSQFRKVNLEESVANYKKRLNTLSQLKKLKRL